jgi:replicative DNA helicase
MMSDLRESGSLEQDSDVVMFLFRRDYYDKHDKPGLAEIIVAKNRHGAIGDISLTYRKEIGQFANYTPMNPMNSGMNFQSNKEAFTAFTPD